MHNWLAEVDFSLVYLACLHRATNRAASVPESCQLVSHAASNQVALARITIRSLRPGNMLAW